MTDPRLRGKYRESRHEAVKEREFPFVVRDGSNADCGARRTEADAIALAKRLQATSAAAGPYRVVRV